MYIFEHPLAIGSSEETAPTDSVDREAEAQISTPGSTSGSSLYDDHLGGDIPDSETDSLIYHDLLIPNGLRTLLDSFGPLGHVGDMSNYDLGSIEQEFEVHNHFTVNQKRATIYRERGVTIIDQAKAILNRSRGSPTAKHKVLELQTVAREKASLGESEFTAALKAALLNKSRNIPKADVPFANAGPEDFEPQPVDWADNKLESLTQAYFRQTAVPQSSGDDDPLKAIYVKYPTLKTPRPDLAYGISINKLSREARALLDNSPVKPLISKLYHLLFVAEVKTLERPLTEARLQCQRSGSAIVFFRVQWNDAAEERALTKIPAKLPQVGPNETSTPDQDSFCFTTAISPSSSCIYVHWREVWAPSGTIYWHTSLLNQYSFEAGLEASTEDFQKHVSNILDYELLDRMPRVWQQAKQLMKRKIKDGDSELPEAKMSRVN